MQGPAEQSLVEAPDLGRSNQQIICRFKQILQGWLYGCEEIFF